MIRTLASALTILLLLGLTQTARANPAWDGVNVEPGQDNAVISLSATDGSNAWALAIRSQSSQIVGLRTTNGTSWQQMMLPQSLNPMVPIFFSALVLMDAMPDIDMGFMTLPGQFAKQLTLSFPDPNHGFLGGQHNMILRYEATDPEAPGDLTMPDCNSNANTNGSTNSNNWPADPDGSAAGCGCASHPASGTIFALLLLAVLLLAFRCRRRSDSQK